VDGEHGRIETRTSLVSSDIGWLQDLHAWPGLKAIGKVVRIREIGTQTSTETAYYLLSTTLSAARFGEVARGHWGVENDQACYLLRLRGGGQTGCADCQHCDGRGVGTHEPDGPRRDGDGTALKAPSAYPAVNG